MKLPATFFLLSVLFFLGGCKKEQPTHTVRFHVESTSAIGETFSQTVKMKTSGIEFTVSRLPSFTEANVVDVQLVRVEAGLCIGFYLDAEGQRELYRQSVYSNGKRIVTLVNGNPIGARLLTGPITDGVLFSFTEFEEEELREIVIALQKNAQIIQKLKTNNKFK